MKIDSVQRNNYTPNFGHSFRVSICLKNENGLGETFVNPYSDAKLYKTLNSKIVGWLNEKYLEQLRNVTGISRKVQKRKPQSDVHEKLAEDLQKIDNDYSKLGMVRSVYRRNKLGFIVTGFDVPIAENVKGIKQIGIAKADPTWNNLEVHESYIKALCKAVKNNVLDYVSSHNVLLRSNNDKEIMLKTIFKKVGENKKGSPIYELDSYEFHENKTSPILKPINEMYKRFKESLTVAEEVKRTVRYKVQQMARRKTEQPQPTLAI
jgi:transcription initiation factor TFIIIB Brf1 subunit/transcription initiation factor TFIIB